MEVEQTVRGPEGFHLAADGVTARARVVDVAVNLAYLHMLVNKALKE